MSLAMTPLYSRLLLYDVLFINMFKLVQ